MKYEIVIVMIFVGSLLLLVGLLMMFVRQDATNSRRQRIADLEHMLGQLLDEEAEIAAEINAVKKQLSEARSDYESYRKRAHEHLDTRSDLLTQ